MKKALKVVAILGGVLVLIVALFFVLLLNMLPSPAEIKRAASPQKIETSEVAVPTGANMPLPEKQSVAATPTKTYEQKVETSKELNLKLLKEDFLNEQVPLATVCNNLSWAAPSRASASSKIKPQDFLSELAKPTDRDPIIESTGPVLRYLFRQSRMRELTDMIFQADENKDNGFMKKAEFYSQLVLVAQQLRDNKEKLDQVMMKSYNLFILSKALGLKPELAKDPATLDFCRQLETNTNQQLDFNADEQAAELKKFLDYAQVKPVEVGYDPSYRANAKFSYNNNNVRLGNIWLEDIFEIDAKAEEAIKKSLPKTQ